MATYLWQRKQNISRMANINKIMVGDEIYDIVPALGNGLKRAKENIEVNIGSGLVYDDGGRMYLHLGTGFAFDEPDNKVTLNFGTAVDSANPGKNSGIALRSSGFTINSEDFKEYLKSLGVVFMQE